MKRRKVARGLLASRALEQRKTQGPMRFKIEGCDEVFINIVLKAGNLKFHEVYSGLDVRLRPVGEGFERYIRLPGEEGYAGPVPTKDYDERLYRSSVDCVSYLSRRKGLH